ADRRCLEPHPVVAGRPHEAPAPLAAQAGRAPGRATDEGVVGSAPAMDVLVIVGDPQVPSRLATRAGHEVRVGGAGMHPDLVAELRGRIPRDIGVIGADDASARAVASELHRAGLPVTYYSFDEQPAPLHGARVLSTTDRGPAMETAESLLDLVGNTPLVRLDRTGRDVSCHLLAKLDFLNPGGSVKDRPAMAMIEAAEQAGQLQPGGTIIEPTS